MGSSYDTPASSPPTALGLFDGVLARGAVRETVSDRAWLLAMLEVEAALARAAARAGLMTSEEATTVTRACRADDFDVSALALAASDTGNPVPALVRQLRETIEGPASGQVHRGATSQDIIDTAAMLIGREALAELVADLEVAASIAAELASKHRATMMAGRTLLQQALPITFGLKAAGWLSGIDDSILRLAEVRSQRLAVQLGGAAGTLASLGSKGATVLGFFAEELGLTAPVIAWHTVRTRIAELAGALGEAAGAIGKIARDVTLLAQTEVAEVRETRGGGGSSTLPQKQNPIAAVSALACVQRAPGLVGTLLSSMVQEHERAAGGWHAEWRPLTDLFASVGSAAWWLRECLEHLEVDTARMRTNLDRTGGLLLAERMSSALAPKLGRQRAHDSVASVCVEAVASGRTFGETLRARPEIAVAFSAAEIDALLDPRGYLGSAELFVDRALAAHAARKKGT